MVKWCSDTGCVFFQAEDGIRYLVRSRGLGDVYKRQHLLNGPQAMALVIMAAVWKQISYNFLFFLAGLQSLSLIHI